MLGSGAVNQETQYFGPGTRLLVLGELGPHALCRRAGVAVDAGAWQGFLWESPVLLSLWLDFRNWQPVDSAR